MKFTFNGETIKNTITDAGKALLAQYFFNNQNLPPLILSFRFIDTINFRQISSSDTFENRHWQFFTDLSINWNPVLYLFSEQSSYIINDDITILTVNKAGTIQGLALVTDTIIFSVAQLTTPRPVLVNEQVELVYTLDW